MLGAHKGLCAQAAGTRLYPVPGVCQGPEQVTAAWQELIEELT